MAGQWGAPAIQVTSAKLGQRGHEIGTVANISPESRKDLFPSSIPPSGLEGIVPLAPWKPKSTSVGAPANVDRALRDKPVFGMAYVANARLHVARNSRSPGTTQLLRVVTTCMAPAKRARATSLGSHLLDCAHTPVILDSSPCSRVSRAAIIDWRQRSPERQIDR
jgi:hypothetical protein